MEGMITDLSMSSDNKKAFKDYLGANSSKNKHINKGLIDGIEFNVEVLTSGHWPTYKMIDTLVLPQSMAECVSIYLKHYSEKAESRKLKWVNSLGSCTIKAKFKKKTYDLEVTTLQAICLISFNDVKDNVSLTFDDLKKKMNITPDVLKRVVHSLSCGKVKVLIKEPKGRSIGLKDKFKVNLDFQSKLRKIRIPMASLDESHNPKRVEEDRTYTIEAAIVRIAKARKQISHQSLVAEVLQQLQFFKPDLKAIKKRIEHLIEREYLERSEDDPSIYNYMA